MFIAIVIGAIVVGCAAAGIICYRKFALPNLQPLSIQDLEICRGIVAARQGYPWICRRALKTGECACYPCEKLLLARGGLPKNWPEMTEAYGPAYGGRSCST